MEFTEDELKYIEDTHLRVRARIDEIQQDPENLLSLAHDESPHIWQRLKEMAAMTREELQADIEAGYVLFVRPLNRKNDSNEISWGDVQPALQEIAKKYKDYV